jgi:ABC-type antimicrobial peptide transport system permease subunit
MSALLVITALSVSMSIMIAIPAGISANQAAAQDLIDELGETIRQTQETINRTLTQIDCTLVKSVVMYPDGSAVINLDGSGGMYEVGGGESGNFGGAMNQSYYSHIANITGVATIAPILEVNQGHDETITVNGGVAPEQYNVTVTDYIIKGIPLNASLIGNYSLLPLNIITGRNLLADEVGKVVFSKNCSAYFNKTVGDAVTILGHNFTVVGIYEPLGFSDNLYVYMNLVDAQVITNNTDTISMLRVFAENPDVVSSVAGSISSMYPELSILTAEQRLSELKSMQALYDLQLASSQEVMNQTQAQAYIEIIITVSATSLIVLFVMLYTVRGRTKEIGTLKAMGASNQIVMGQFLLEGTLLSLIAGVVGVVIGTIAAPYLTSVLLPTVGGSIQDMYVMVSPVLVLIALGISVLLGALGSLYPALRAARTRPVEAMRYE